MGLKLTLKMLTVAPFLIDMGSEFHTCGAAMLNERSPSVT